MWSRSRSRRSGHDNTLGAGPTRCRRGYNDRTSGRSSRSSRDHWFVGNHINLDRVTARVPGRRRRPNIRSGSSGGRRRARRVLFSARHVRIVVLTETRESIVEHVAIDRVDLATRLETLIAVLDLQAIAFFHQLVHFGFFARAQLIERERAMVLETIERILGSRGRQWRRSSARARRGTRFCRAAKYDRTFGGGRRRWMMPPVVFVFVFERVEKVVIGLVRAWFCLVLFQHVQKRFEKLLVVLFMSFIYFF